MVEMLMRSENAAAIRSDGDLRKCRIKYCLIRYCFVYKGFLGFKYFKNGICRIQFSYHLSEESFDKYTLH